MIYSYLTIDDPRTAGALYGSFPEGTDQARSVETLAALGVVDGAPIHIGDPESDEPHPVVTYFKYPPGVVLPRHSHPSWRMEIILRGSMITDRGEVLRPGDIMINAAGEFYGPHTMGPDGATTMEVFATQEGLQTDAEGDISLSEAFKSLNAHLLP